MDGKHRQAVIEVFPEFALLHRLLQIAMGSGDDPDVDLDGLWAPQPLELPFLKYPQQLHLKFRRGYPISSRNKVDPVGQFKAADLFGHGPGIGAFFPAEQLAFDQRGGQGGRIDDHQGTILGAG